VPEFYNRTRRSSSIGGKLLRSGRLLELPVYWLLRTSDLAREGFENSGSYRFADHIYDNRPSGTYAIGRWLDSCLLRMPAVQAFRARYFNARDELYRFLQERAGSGNGVDVASVPCGIPRELVAAVEKYRAEGGDLARVRFHVLDLDPHVLADGAEFARKSSVTLIPHQGDALDIATYGDRFDFITSTGFGEFLDDEKLARLYSIFYEVLRPGGLMVTSAMRRTRVAGYLLDLAELHVRYRSAEELAAIARAAGFPSIRTSTDRSGIQGFLKATK
jgi:SAM-dependent methyltransferase